MDAADRGTGKVWRKRRVPPARGRQKKTAPAREKQAGTGHVVRVLALCAGLVVFTVGAQGSPIAGGVAGSVQTGAGQEVAGAQTEFVGALTADSRALLSYSRSTVRTVSKDGKGSLNLASAGMRRPPVGSLMAPLEVLVPSSPYGIRISPITGALGEFHWGQDYASPCGTRVYSTDAGVVRAVGWHQWGGGNRVEIDHGNGLISTYNHLEAIAVETGDSVDVGQVIAKVGTTGSSTGCHLHFETILNGAHTDPLGWTLLPIKQLDELRIIEMLSYAPADGKPVTGTPSWAVPAIAEHSHTIDGTREQPANTPAPTGAGPAPSTPATRTTPGTPATPAPVPTLTPASPTPDPAPTTTPVPSPTTTSEPLPTTAPETSPTTGTPQEPSPATTPEAPGTEPATDPTPSRSGPVP